LRHGQITLRFRDIATLAGGIGERGLGLVTRLEPGRSEKDDGVADGEIVETGFGV